MKSTVVDESLSSLNYSSVPEKISLLQIIKELTKIYENKEITSENVLFWAKRVQVQRAQSAIMNSLMEVKEFDKLKVVNKHTKGKPKKIHRDKNSHKVDM